MKYFGTDGIRRIANTELTPEFVYRVAKAAAYVFAKHCNHKPTILIGKDTRISGDLIESAITAGFLSYGANVENLGVIPTPGVAYLTKKLNADASVVISASHNTYEFNGIKFFSNEGTKIPDELEIEIENVIENDEIDNMRAVGDGVGISRVRRDLIEEYIYFFKDTFKDDFNKYNLEEFKVVIDVANGATYDIADKVFNSLGIKYEIINNKPNGININDDCGSTHLDNIKKYVIDNNFNMGIAYDGDGDRCLLIDENGNEVDGDKILAIVSKYMKNKGELHNNTLVATVMSNLGLKKYCKSQGIEFIETKVGDRNVLESMKKNNYNLGGEQSGHIIFLDYNPTGDGILTSLVVIKILMEYRTSLSEACNIIKTYPQVLVNAKVNSNRKEDYKKDLEITEEIKKIEEEFKDNGRVLIRPSGTEPLVRVMIEGENQNYITEKASNLAKLIENKLT